MKPGDRWGNAVASLAIPIAAGALYNAVGLELRPEVSALLTSSIIVATNAVLLKREHGRLLAIGKIADAGERTVALSGQPA